MFHKPNTGCNNTNSPTTPYKKRMPKISNYSPLHIPLNKMEKGLVWDLQHSKFGIRLFWTRDWKTYQKLCESFEYDIVYDLNLYFGWMGLGCGNLLKGLFIFWNAMFILDREGHQGFCSNLNKNRFLTNIYSFHYAFRRI